MELIAHIEKSWGWTGINPAKVVAENDFGNLIVRDTLGQYWRICPEDLYCELIAADRAALDILICNEEFEQDWNMSALVKQARERFGALGPDRKFCLKIPGALAGEYGGDNLACISLTELIGASGDIARQIRDLPDGTQVKFRFTE
jgi:hypothetical protein